MRGFPALRQLTHEERVQLMACLNGMLPRDGNVSLHSYVLRKLAQMHLRDDLNPGARVSRLTLQDVQQDAQVLFSVVAQHGHSDETSARRALAVRELLLQRAAALGLLEGGAPRERVSFASREAEDDVIARLLDAEVTTPSATRPGPRWWRRWPSSRSCRG